jgi:general secretion pathway protein A
MYNSYFGFREKPFKLVPNPDYLFLSKSHEIALAHLTYATEQGEGFAVITGEVGTGKTTLCRNYLESLDANTSSAYIFNPKLESAQLLASICQEFGIKTGATTIKALLDLLNSFLIEQNAAGKNVVVLIDEAQGLSIENLELMRMLSNLETTRSKLLQIILVGQPELGDQLDSHELRQLAQRISLNYHLVPLSAKESEAYIRHRLSIASQGQAALFTVNACRSVYHYSRGIPRLINIVCDRALLLAYSHSHPKVNRKVVQAAIRELQSRGQVQTDRRQWSFLMGGGLLLFVASVAIAGLIWRERQAGRPIAQVVPSGGIVVAKVPPMEGSSTAKNGIPAGPAVELSNEPVQTNHADGRVAAPALPAASGTFESTAPAGQPPGGSTLDEPQTQDSPSPLAVSVASPLPTSGQPAPEPSAIAASVPSSVAPGPPAGNFDKARSALSAALEGMDARSSRKTAVTELLTIWGQPRPNVDLLPQQLKDPEFIELSARQYEMRAYAAPWRLSLVERLDLPAILTLRHPVSGEPVYLTLTGINGSNLRLSIGESRPIETSLVALEPQLTGQMYVFWRNTLEFDMIIGYGANNWAVLEVQRLLRQIGYDAVLLSSVFDDSTKAAVQSFQRKKGLNDDGLVGPLTKIMLLKEAGTEAMPRLIDGRGVDS